MPNLSSPLVQDRQIWYASRPSYVKRMVERSRRYLYYIVEELEKRGMPTELALLPMVESAFNPMAYSRAHASGLWQFIPSTGKTLRAAAELLVRRPARHRRLDQRRARLSAVPLRDARRLAPGARLLQLGRERGGARASKRTGAKGLPTDYLSLTMPAETRYYVPKLQALKNIIANPHSFGIDLEPVPNAPYFVTVAKTRDIDVRLAAKLADMPLAEFLALNPGHNRPVIVADGTPALVLPADKAQTVPRQSRGPRPAAGFLAAVHAQAGRQAGPLAAKNGISLARLKEINGIGRRTRWRRATS